MQPLTLADYYGNDTVFFKNPMHLNSYGKDCFTKTIASDIDSLFMKGEGISGNAYHDKSEMPSVIVPKGRIDINRGVTPC